MILRQFLHEDPIAISYLFGCGGKAAGAVVDPVGDFAVLHRCRSKGRDANSLRDRHAPACGSCVVRTRPRCEPQAPTISCSTKRRLQPPFRGVHDGDVLELGNVTIEILHTPGHTPEHISLLVRDRTRSDQPWFVMTGHTLDGQRSWPHRTCRKRGGRRTGSLSQCAAPQGAAGLSGSPAWRLFRIGLR